MTSTDSIDMNRSVDARLWWLGVSLFIVALVAASMFVIWQGSNRTVRASQLTPEPGSTVSVRQAIRVLFADRMDKGSVEGNVFVSPALPIELAWDNDSKQLRILPLAAMIAETEYTITVGPGVRDINGVEMQGQIEWTFGTRAPRVAYTSFRNDVTPELWISDLSGENAQRLSAPEQFVLDFEPSPDGSMIVYTVEEGPNTVNLWRAGTEEIEMTRLTEEQNTIYGAPRFNSTGDLLAVEVREEFQIGDQGSQLTPPRLQLRRPTDGSPAGDIYGGQGAIAHTPRWSPDGTHIAFFEANANALGVFNFTADLRFFPAESAQLGSQSWSPDGRAIIYTAVHLLDQGAQQNIVLRDLELGTEISLGESNGDQADPAWSPDGTTVAYIYKPPRNDTNNEGIWLMRPDGTGKVPLVSEPNVIYSLPLWSPDGQWLLFGRFNLNNDKATQTLWAIRRDGSDLHQVAEEGFLFAWVP